VLPVLARLVDNELTDAGAQHYRIAARRLAKMRKLASGSAEAAGVDELIAELRDAPPSATLPAGVQSRRPALK